jgi:hypothetical protein
VRNFKINVTEDSGDGYHYFITEARKFASLESLINNCRRCANKGEPLLLALLFSLLSALAHSLTRGTVLEMESRASL